MNIWNINYCLYIFESLDMICTFPLVISQHPTSFFTNNALFIEKRELEIGQRLNQAPPRKYLDATEALISWLTEVEEVLAERVYITDISTMEKNVTLYQVLIIRY